MNITILFWQEQRGTSWSPQSILEFRQPLSSETLLIAKGFSIIHASIPTLSPPTINDDQSLSWDPSGNLRNWRPSNTDARAWMLGPDHEWPWKSLDFICQWKPLGRFRQNRDTIRFGFSKLSLILACSWRCLGDFQEEVIRTELDGWAHDWMERQAFTKACQGWRSQHQISLSLPTWALSRRHCFSPS